MITTENSLLKQEISNYIGVVVVTYNRLNTLKIALKSYEDQSCKPKYVFIIDNKSNDGTKEYLDQWKSNINGYRKYVVHLNENTGGSGGFFEGLKRTVNLDADWIWLADDDAYPDLSAIKKADEYIKSKILIGDNINISAICGAVINNGNIDVGHRRRISQKWFQVSEENIGIDEYKNESFELNLFSYVGVMINKNVLKKVGLTKKEYFIYYDDTEHSMRLSNVGKIICFPEIKITHNQPVKVGNKNFSWQAYYGMRNKLDFYKIHFPNAYRLAICKGKLKNYFKILLRYKVKEARLYLDAINDAQKGVLGKHNIYKPGWNLKD